jgi:hypothetical protein
MFDLALMIFFFVMTYRVAAALYREAAIFREFEQPRSLGLLVLLFPLGPFVLYIGMLRLPLPLAFVGAAACYIPALYLARRMGLALERARTDRVKGAQDAVAGAFGTALAGMIYVALHLIFTVSVAAIN